mmetsp:Transcript_95009/g.203985  ORF Transcript_95009/g.203985 Transcript_95009/m.203985 type:complete len:405 (-) Transcript_95009:12-1226(-)
MPRTDQPAPEPEGSEEDSEGEIGGVKHPRMLRMTPLELDIQLQGAELVYRSILAGQRIAMDTQNEDDDWHREVLGEGWVQENNRQRKIVLQQMKDEGENTPEWMESQANMGDIAWEVFESGQKGERVRKLKDVDRVEIIEQFKELYPKVRDSYFARCGAGDRLWGLRACIGIFRLFIRDPEVLDLCAISLRLTITDHAYNRDGLAALSLPMPPEERLQEHEERGWAFLRAALDAYMVQAGGEPYDSGAKAPEEGEEEEGEAKKPEPAIDRTPTREVAIRIAECVVAAKGAPALVAQLKLLREPTVDNHCQERRELKAMLPGLIAKTEELIGHESTATSGEGFPVALKDLLDMLRSASPPEGQSASSGSGDGQGPAPGDDDKKDPGLFGNLASGVRGLLGRGSAA